MLPFNDLENALFVWYSNGGLRNRPFGNQTLAHNLNTSTFGIGMVQTCSIIEWYALHVMAETINYKSVIQVIGCETNGLNTKLRVHYACQDQVKVNCSDVSFIEIIRLAHYSDPKYKTCLDFF